MKLNTFGVTALVAVASVTSATDFQPALRALAAAEPAAPNADMLTAGPTERQSPSAEAAAATGKESTAVVDAEGKKSKEWWGGGLGWGRPWGGFGGYGGYGGGWGGYGGGYGGGWGW